MPLVLRSRKNKTAGKAAALTLWEKNKLKRFRE